MEGWNKRKPEQEEGEAFFCDMSITRTAGLTAFGEKMREFTDALVTAYQSGDSAIKDSIDACIVKQDYSIFLKAMDYEVDMSVLLGSNNSYYMTGSHDAEGVPVVIQYCADGSTKYFYPSNPADTHDYIGWGSTFDATYKQLAFDKATGWSRWLEVNQQMPNLFSPTEWEPE